MNIDLTTEQALQIRAALRAAQVTSDKDRNDNDILFRYYPTRTQCDDLVELLDTAAHCHEAAMNTFRALMFGEYADSVVEQ